MSGTEKDLEAVIKVMEDAEKYGELAHVTEAATGGLNRIGVDQRGRSDCGVTIFVLDRWHQSHQHFPGRASP